MKTTLFTLTALFCLLTGCKKEPTNTTSVGLQPKLQFYANGTLVNRDATKDAQLGWIDYPKILLLTSSTDQNYKYELNLEDIDHKGFMEWTILQNQGLSVYSYDYKNSSYGTFCSVFMKTYGYNTDSKVSDYNITITQIKDSLFSGTFSGNIAPAYYSGGNTNLIVTNGTFSNLPIKKN